MGIEADQRQRLLWTLLGMAAAWSGIFWAILSLSAVGQPDLANYRLAWVNGGVASAWQTMAGSPTLPALVVLFLSPLLALLAGWRGAAGSGSASTVLPPAEATAPMPVVAPIDPDAVALRLLATLQEEARLLDFVSEDVSNYSDEEVGAAARGVHAGLVRALRDRVQFTALRSGEEGDRVTIDKGFSPASVRLQGSPTGEPPWEGVLVHPGWMATKVELARPTEGCDPRILAPAEIEVEQG